VLTALLMLFGYSPFDAFLGTLAAGILWEFIGIVARDIEPDPKDVMADFIGASALPGLIGLAGLLA